jgi:FtsP/CotA-like multicopper oxidase with cupredoxin domain
MDRRSFLLAGASIPMAIMLKGCVPPTTGIEYDLFTHPLKIPKELFPTAGVIDLSINAGSYQFRDGLYAPTYYLSEVGVLSENYLGPTLRLKNSEDVKINYTNNLPEPTTMHGHGMHVPPKMDGTPHQTIQPGETWTADYNVNQIACTNWYHPHTMHKTAEHVYKGLAGMIIIDDDTINTLDLPKTYGVDDIPLIVQDKDFDSNGIFTYSPSMMDKMRGLKGSNFMVNGVITPFLEVEAKQIRFRLLNASNSRVYNFSLKGKSFTQIAGDESYLEKGIEMTELRLSPAERAEIIIDFTTDFDNDFFLYDLDSNKPLMQIKVNKDDSVTPTYMPTELVTLESYALTGNEPVHTFSLTGGMGELRIAIDGGEAKAMDFNRIDDVVVPKDEWQIWKISNDMPMTHNFHVHGTHFRVLKRWLGDIEQIVPENEKGYKDVVRIDGKAMPPMGAPAHSVEILVRMTDFTDVTTPYMFHCHILEHEDLGMMGQFLVV